MKIAIRMDDITPAMDLEKFDRFKAILDKHGIKPLIGVVPECKDEKLNLSEPIEDFWKFVKELQKSGWVIAMHGFNHVYTTKEAGVFPIGGKSEFTAIEGGGMLSKVLVKMYSFSMNRAKKVFFQNERNLEFMKKMGVATKNAALLPGSGVNLTEHPFREYPAEEGGIHFLAVIRIMRDKGIGEYLEAAEMIASEDRNVFFDLVGEYEEDEREKYESKILDLEKRGIIKRRA